jgi:hypothetical protein
MGVSKNTIRYYARNNGLMHLKLGSNLYFTKRWLEEYVQGCITMEKEGSK